MADHMVRAWYLTAAGLLAVTGCVTTNATLLDTTVRPVATCPTGVRVYLTADAVPEDAVELALLNSSGAELSSEAGMINSQRKKAAGVGATGLVLGARTDVISGASFTANSMSVRKERKGDAIAVYAPSDTARAYGACRQEQAALSQRDEEE